MLESINKDKLISSGLSLIGISGQLLARIIYKNGSIDKPYLLLCAYFPFSIIPSIAMYFDYIKNGESDQVYDKTALIGTIFLFIIPLLLFKILNREGWLTNEYKNIIGVLIQFIFIGIIYYIYNQRFKTVCKTNNNPALYHAIILSPVILILGRLLLIGFNYIISIYNLDHLFNLSIFSHLLDNNSNTDNTDIICLYLSTAISFLLIYIFLNMYYSNKDNLDKTCNLTTNNKILIIGLIINLILPLFIKPFIIEYDFNSDSS